MCNPLRDALRRKMFLLVSLILLLILTGNAMAQLNPATVDTGHVYLLEDTGGTDDSANSNTLTIVGDPEVVTGITGNALQFDGVDDGINIPDSDFINVNAGPFPNRTVLAMFKCDDVDKPGKQTVFEEGGTTRGLSIYVSEGLVYAAGWNRAEYNWDGAWLSAPVESGNWYGVALVIREGAEAVEDDKFEMWLNGQLVEKAPGGQLHNHGDDGAIGYTNQNNVFHDGNASPATGHYFEGAIDEVWILNEALTEVELSAFKGKVWPFAFGPTPKDGVLYQDTWGSLSWKPGGFALSHNVYIGDNFEDVNSGAESVFLGNQATTEFIVGFPGMPYPEGLVPGTTYYWRIDEVNDAEPNSPWKGDVWSFWVQPEKAYDPSPADGVKYVLPDMTLDWAAGMAASLHYAHFGENFDDVNNAEGGQLLTEATFSPGTLESNKTYYWRIDEFAAGITHKGDVWSFTTVPEVQVTNPNLTLWWSLDEAEGATAVDMSGHGNHGVINGDTQWVDGFQGTGLMFGADDYVEVAAYPGITGTAARTLCAWIKTSDNNRTIMSWGLNTTGNKWRMRSDATGGLRIEVNGGYHYGVTNIADGRWHHVAITFEDDGTPDVVDTLLFVDGQPETTLASQETAIDTDTGGVVRIGKSPYHTSGFIGVMDDARIYDKVLTLEEIQQVMLGNTKLAGTPVPARDEIVDIRDISSLSWSAGDTASSHDVYLGTDKDAVAAAAQDSPEFQGNQAGNSLSLAGLVELGGGDYFWRIDEIEADGTVQTGMVWKFTVPDYLLVDDMESYNDIDEGVEGSNRIYNAWVDGFTDPTNGSTVGHLDPPFAEQTIVHSGNQSMPLAYDNAVGKSEATLTLTSGRDWTSEGVSTLVIWYIGDPANAPETMYVVLNGTAGVDNPNPDAALADDWTEWRISLQDFGINLTNINTVTIGFGNRNNPSAGGAGSVFVDDIRLYPPTQ